MSINYIHTDNILIVEVKCPKYKRGPFVRNRVMGEFFGLNVCYSLRAIILLFLMGHYWSSSFMALKWDMGYLGLRNEVMTLFGLTFRAEIFFEGSKKSTSALGTHLWMAGPYFIVLHSSS